MANKLIVLDAGHGGNGSTAGKRSPQSMGRVVYEWDMNNNVCNYIAQYLKDYVVDVVRIDDTTGKKDISLAERVKRTNARNPQAMVSIHHNAGGGTGVETYLHTSGSAKDKQLATIIQGKMVAHTGMRNRGVKKASFAVLTCKATIPCVLVEGGFYDTKSDFDYITSEQGQRAYAKAVVEGLVEFLDLKKAVTQPTPPSQPSTGSAYKVGDKVKVQAHATHYAPTDGSTQGKAIPNWVKNTVYTVSKVNGNKVLLQEITSWVWDFDIAKEGNTTSSPSFKEYQVKINTSSLNVRKGAGVDYPVVTTVKSGDVYTIVDEKNGWGLLKSYKANRDGWINLSYTTKR